MYKEIRHKANDSCKVGTVIGLRGLRGELKVKASLNNTDLLKGIKTVRFEVDGKLPQHATVRSIHTGSSIIYLSLEEYTDRTTTATLIGANVFTDKSQLQSLAKNEWWVKDLVGIQVFTTDGLFVGTVCDVMEANGSILEICTQAKDTSLVPFVKELVPLVDISAGRIEIVNLPGLIRLE